ncbi:hypothetical protein LWI29_003874 [Acer saccharum]|uniref:Uncharacterized protein n=1 Tax=Acer saccharum TaxID=4024 RepID=A0AA39T2F4_ACESA|nr:hypothetical protein LWI29_003874 [Acer saccharum]
MASQTSLLNSRARAASPSPSQLPPATVTFSAADTVTVACREPPVPPAVSRASPTAPDSALDASHVAPDSPAAASEPGPAASPPAATATHHMVTRTRCALLRSKIGVSEMPTILRGRIKDTNPTQSLT